ncbi:MAG: ParB N-terminal domain-containing protein [Acidobacteriota bacterium]
MTDLIKLPLNKLTAWEGNVRKTQNKASIDELAASIKAIGLQQNLVVKKTGKTFAVVAGGRRLLALQKLAKAGDIEPNFEVPCRITEAKDASEISLAENVVRENMHPADEFEAFRNLVDNGMPTEDVGARFGRTKTFVEQRLKLARVHPKLLKEYRKGELTLEQVMAFTITDDHAAQWAVFEGMSAWTNARQIRDALTKADIAATDKRVVFVTLRAYEARGGTLKRDLFSDSVYIQDPPLFDTLVTEGLDKKAKPVRKEGWKWVETATDFGYEQKQQFHRLDAEPVPLTAEEQQQLDKLRAEYDVLDEAWQESDQEDEPKQLLKLAEQIEEIENREGVWTPEQLAVAGAVVYIGHDGKAEVERGLVRSEDMPKKGTATSKPVNASDEDADATELRSDISAALIETLTAHKSAAIAATLLDAPELGLATVVYGMVLDVFGHRGSGSSVQVQASTQSLHRVEGSAAFQAIEQARESWGEQLPGNPDDIWDWCLKQEQAVLLDLLTFYAANSVNAVQLKADRPDGARLSHAGKLASALKLDMTAWFKPTAENYFNRVSKPQIMAALQEARNQPPAPAWDKLKKAELAVLAERELADKTWLPEPLR